jgi:ribosomal protein S18 acetylase RimI-like enzyme
VNPRIEFHWPTAADERLRAGVHRLIRAVVELGGAVGWLTPPGRAETDRWLNEVLDRTRAGDAALALALLDGEVAAGGLWRRGTTDVFRHRAELQKVMAHPKARGLGLGRRLLEALIDHARGNGIETLTLGVRGNNHGAIELYERLGFREWGRLPNSIEVGDERYDDVKMFLDLGRPPHVILRGSPPDGPGSSPRRRRP